MNHPILHLLGLAKRAGKLEIGEEPVGAVARAKRAKLILLASDTPANTNRRAATFGQIGNVLQLQLPFTKEEIGLSLGRNSIAMLALTDAGFAGAIGDKLALIDAEKYGSASLQLRAKADRTLARQKEKRQHEKNLLRGKGKPWAVPNAVVTERKEKKEKKCANTANSSEVSEKSRNKRPNFKDPKKKYETKRHDDFSKKKPNKYNNKTENHHENSSEHSKNTKFTGKRLVIKNKPSGRGPAQP